MGKSFSEELERCADFADIFELVKTGVEKTLDRGRAGLMLGLANFGGGPGQFLGGYYTVDSNLIVLNSFPLDLIRKKDERLLKPYIFHVLLLPIQQNDGVKNHRQNLRKTVRELPPQRPNGNKNQRVSSLVRVRWNRMVPRPRTRNPHRARLRQGAFDVRFLGNRPPSKSKKTRSFPSRLFWRGACTSYANSARPIFFRWPRRCKGRTVR